MPYARQIVQLLRRNQWLKFMASLSDGSSLDCGLWVKLEPVGNSPSARWERLRRSLEGMHLESKPPKSTFADEGLARW